MSNLNSLNNIVAATNKPFVQPSTTPKTNESVAPKVTPSSDKKIIAAMAAIGAIGIATIAIAKGKGSKAKQLTEVVEKNVEDRIAKQTALAKETFHGAEFTTTELKNKQTVLKSILPGNSSNGGIDRYIILDDKDNVVKHVQIIHKQDGSIGAYVVHDKDNNVLKKMKTTPDYDINGYIKEVTDYEKKISTLTTLNEKGKPIYLTQVPHLDYKGTNIKSEMKYNSEGQLSNAIFRVRQDKKILKDNVYFADSNKTEAFDKTNPIHKRLKEELINQIEKY